MFVLIYTRYVSSPFRGKPYTQVDSYGPFESLEKAQNVHRDHLDVGHYDADHDYEIHELNGDRMQPGMVL